MQTQTTISGTQPRHAIRIRLPMYGTVLLYYWLYLYLRVIMPPPEESALSYALTVFPVALAAASGALFALARGARPLADRTTIALVAFIVIATLVSVARGDWASVRSAGLITLTLIWLATPRSELTVTVLNRFFVSSIVAGGLWYLLGLSEYGLLPGQYAEGADRGIEWRVSLFPFVAESGFFALIVFLANQTRRRGWTRLLLCAASLYFLLLSGMRSAVLALILCEMYIYVNARRRSTFRATQLLLLLAVFVGMIAFSSLTLVLPSFSEGVVGNYLFRTDSLGDSETAVNQTVYRGWLWLQHFGLFLSSPWSGVGTFDFSSTVSEILFEGQDEKGSESFITGWLARLGLCFLPFIVYFGLLCRRAAASPGLLEGALFLVLGVAAFAYGSFLVPYNFIFLVLFRLLLQGARGKEEPHAVGAIAAAALKKI